IAEHVQHIAAAVEAGDRLTRDRVAAAAKTVFLVGSLGLFGPWLAALAASAGNLELATGVIGTARKAFQSKARLLDAAMQRKSGVPFSVNAQQEMLAGAQRDAVTLGLVARVLPLLVVVEAAQYLDPASVSLLQAICRAQQAAGLMV